MPVLWRESTRENVFVLCEEVTVSEKIIAVSEGSVKKWEAERDIGGGT